jgi:hypothetical protein
LRRDHITNRNNGRKASECVPAKVPMVPSICQKRIQQRMSLGKNFSTWTGPFRHARPYKPKHKALCQKGIGGLLLLRGQPEHRQCPRLRGSAHRAANSASIGLISERYQRATKSILSKFFLRFIFALR